MKNFSNLISQANDNITFIEKKVQAITSLKYSLLEANKEEEKEISKKINNIINDIIEARGRMDKIIKNLESDLVPAQKDEDENENKTNIEDDSDLRLKKNLFDAMIKKYQRVIQKFSDEENDIKQEKEKKLFREAEIGLGRDLTSQEKEEILENPQKIQQIYENKLKGKAHNVLQNAVRDLEERHRDIKKLEKSIIELSKMVSELSKMVKYQGEMIDNIVENVSKSKDYIKKGEEELVEAKKKMKCKKNIKCIILLIAIAILLIIIIPVIVKLI